MGASQFPHATNCDAPIRGLGGGATACPRASALSYGCDAPFRGSQTDRRSWVPGVLGRARCHSGWAFCQALRAGWILARARLESALRTSVRRWFRMDLA